MLHFVQRWNRIGSDLPQQRGEVVVEAFAEHQAVLEGQHHDEGLHDRPSGWLDPQEAADMSPMPGRFGHVGLILGPAGALAWPALYRDIEGGPPLAIVAG